MVAFTCCDFTKDQKREVSELMDDGGNKSRASVYMRLAWRSFACSCVRWEGVGRKEGCETGRVALLLPLPALCILFRSSYCKAHHAVCTDANDGLLN
jgi:hypothetical protein